MPFDLLADASPHIVAAHCHRTLHVATDRGTLQCSNQILGYMLDPMFG